MTGLGSWGSGGGGSQMPEPTLEQLTRHYLKQCGYEPSDDAVAQMTDVFLPAVGIMCGRSSLRGEIWRQSGWRGSLFEARKKMHRLWYAWWENDRADDDSALDLLNYIGFALRARDADIGPWGIYGDPSTIQKGE